MQALSQLETLGDAFLPHLNGFLSDTSPPAKVQDYARRLATEAWEHREAIDARLRGAAEHWEVARMTLVDRNVLRVAACELLYHPDVPAAAAINEAVEIGKMFGTAESGAFINGVLDALRKQMDAERG